MFLSKRGRACNGFGFNQYHLIFYLVAIISLDAIAQSDSLVRKLAFEGDFRFRVEQDWNVRQSDGNFADDRSRLRYRARFGLNYQYNAWSNFGFRIRTGDPDKQQDPQITLGDQFSGIPISFEKAFARFHNDKFYGWIGKNTFPFERQNELFWSDNVFPEGIAFGANILSEKSALDALKINTGHFVFITDGSTFGSDSYVQGIQLSTSWWNQRLILFPSYYFFRNMPDIPDGNENFRLDYKMLHMGMRFYIARQPKWGLEVDYYYNLEDLEEDSNISDEFEDQKTGITLSTHYGSLDKKGNWFFRISYNYQERYSAVDYLAQNDWARWDYSAQDSADGRLTNYNGFEMMVGYAITSKMDLEVRSFFVKQLVPLGPFKESNSRIRFDYNVRF